jgi:hypothetical protein
MKEIDLEFYKKNGYCVVKNVFSEKQISDFRKLAYLSMENDQKNGKGRREISKIKNVWYSEGDLSAKPLSKVLFSEEILKIARKVLDTTPVYFGDSTYQVGAGDRGYHRDNIDRTANVGDDWKGEYELIRFGVYLQDHNHFSGGLKVIEGSHLGRNGKRKFVNSNAGDVVVWNKRTLHSGNGQRLKLFPNLVLGYRLENLLPNFLFLNGEKERISCFMSFAKEGENLNRYIEKYMKVKLHKTYNEFLNHKDFSQTVEKDLKFLSNTQ